MTLDDLRGRHIGEAAVVLGNGPSRLALDLDEINNDAWLIGCNVIVRDYADVDYICFGDPGPAVELSVRAVVGPTYIYWRPQGKSTTLEIPEPFVFINEEMLPLRPRGDDRALYSGNLAMAMAAWMRFEIVVLAGFDGGKDNVYDGTPLYGRRDGVHHYHWQQAEYAVEIAARAVMAAPEYWQIGPHTCPFAKPMEVPEEWLAKDA